MIKSGFIEQNHLFKILIIFLIALSTATYSQHPPGKLTHEVIIDTDCAVDDMRAIALMLSRPEIIVKAILVSDGSLPPSEGVVKVRSLLNEFGRNDIPVATGYVLEGVDPDWRSFNRKVRWGNEKVEPAHKLDAVECLTNIVSASNEEIDLVCLGPLTNIARAIGKNSGILEGIERIIWYNESVNPLKGFNYTCDQADADLVFNADVRIDVISNLEKDMALFDTTLYAVSVKSNTRQAEAIRFVYSQPEVTVRLNQGHFRLCDDLVVLYMTNPELFDMNIKPPQVKVRYNQDFNVQAVREAITDMLNGTYVSEQNVVFNRFPDQKEMFNYDVREIMDTVISRYGYDEWKAAVMTDEFHGHLGVFSIVGAKMGILAREYFDVQPDELSVISFAGSTTPYSCLNDGIQVSTGSTLGMGLIRLAADSVTTPSAIFTYKGRSIRITLKEEYLEQVNADINEGIIKFGLADEGYWKLVRRNALKYWLEWDRNKIFDVKEIQ